MSREHRQVRIRDVILRRGGRSSGRGWSHGGEWIGRRRNVQGLGHMIFKNNCRGGRSDDAFGNNGIWFTILWNDRHGNDGPRRGCWLFYAL